MKLELIRNPTMFSMMERGIRGGMSVITHRLAKPNNVNLPNYNPQKPDSYCIYLDANNLYGWAMSQSMPQCNLHFLTRREIENLDIMTISDDADVGYILEVDLTYPKRLHDMHNDLPLAPDRRHVHTCEWSPKQKQLSPKSLLSPLSSPAPVPATDTPIGSSAKRENTTSTTGNASTTVDSGSNKVDAVAGLHDSDSGGDCNKDDDDDDDEEEEDDTGSAEEEGKASVTSCATAGCCCCESHHNHHSTKKLIADFYDKNNYVIYYRNLKLYVRLGMRITCVHRVVAFRQSKWLKRYIELNTELRKRARNAFEKDFFKLMNNSVFGKTMENVRNRRNFQLVSDSRTLSRIVRKPSFERCQIINSDLVLTLSLRQRIKLFKPIFVGFTILDNSKQLMYEFHYDVVKERYGQRAQLCFTDTDSLLYLITTPDIYSDMYEQRDLYDFSDYPADHDLQSNANKKVLGKMKDEMCGKPIQEFVGLRSKMYSIQVGSSTTGSEQQQQKKTAKGVKRETIRKCLTHEMFRQCLLSGKSVMKRMRNIRSFNHKIYSTVQTKVALSSFDDKRYILRDGIHTRAYGHYRNKSAAAATRRQKDNCCASSATGGKITVKKRPQTITKRRRQPPKGESNG